MGKKDIGRFGADAKRNAALAAEVKQLGGNLAAIVNLAKGKGYNFTEAELTEYAKARKGKLSEEQLKQVAGGAAVVAVHVAVVG